MEAIEKTRLKCCECGIELSEGINYVKQDDENYCCDCFNEKFCICAECSDVVLREDIITTHSNREICQDCYDSDYFTCYACGEVHHNDYGHRYDGDDYCEDCFDERYFVCDSCGRTYSQDDYGGDGYCVNCYDDNNEESHRYLHGHDYKPQPVFFCLSGEKQPFYMGIELEVETPDVSIIDTIQSKLWYFKQDGSVNGFELAIYPLSYEYILDNKDMLHKTFKYLSEHNCRSYTAKDCDCGLHIHTDKTSITSFQLYKLLKLFYENPEYILKISQRRKSSLERWASVFSHNEQLVYKAKNKTDSHRYTAINLCPENTIEIRIFRGTLNIDGFLKAVQFVKAVIDFTKEVSANKVNPVNFRDFVISKNEYKYLATYLINKTM